MDMVNIGQRFRFVFGAVLLLLVVSAGVGTASAGNALCPQNAPAHIRNSEVCRNQTTDPVAGPNGLIADVTNIIAIAAGIIAVVMIMYSGYQYIASRGDSGKIEEAKKTLFWSVVGLIVIVLVRSIILFVISKL